MSKTILTEFKAVPDQGNLKRLPGEYAFTQNARGWGKRGKKRAGVQTRVTLAYGIMGIFDVKVDGDPLSPDKIMVYDNNGTITFYEFSELTSIFDFLFDTGSSLNLQSPNLNWYNITVTAGGILGTTQIAAPGTTISSDLRIDQNQLLGFNKTTTFVRLYIEANFVKTKQYNLSTPITSYTTAQAFTTGFGPVFQDANLLNFRLTVNNSGAIGSIQV